MQVTASSSSSGRGPMATSTARVCSSRWNCRGPCTLSSTSRSSARLANRSSSPGAACSANRLDAASRSSRRPAPAWLTSRMVRSCRPSISAARLASRSPPGVNAIPDAVRTNSRSPSSLRSWPMLSDTAASDTSRSTAAFFTEPSRTTAANARSWVGVTDATLIPLNPPRATLKLPRGPDRSGRDRRADGVPVDAARIATRIGTRARATAGRRPRATRRWRGHSRQN